MRSLLALTIMLILYTGSINAAEVRAVSLEWDANDPIDEVVEYVVSYGPASGEYTLEKSAGNNTELLINIPVGSDIYYFAVQAISRSGVKSDFSDEVNTRKPKVPGFRIKGILLVEI